MIRTFQSLVVFLLFSSVQLLAYQYDLCVCAIFHNEARFMKEWIDFHKVVGVQHFYLYNNESTDNYQEILDPYIREGSVELINWPHRGPKSQFAFVTQARAYQDAINKSKTKTHWLAMIDLDEFMVPKEGETITGILEKYFRHNVGVAMYWQMFGTSNIYMLDPNRLMIEQLTLKAPEDHIIHTMFKCIVYPEFVRSVDNPHFAYYLYGQATNTNGIPTDPSNEKRNYTTKLIQLNHYWPRDIYNIYTLKWPRHQQYGCTDFEEYLKSLEILNSVEDLEIQIFIPLMKELSHSNGS